MAGAPRFSAERVAGVAGEALRCGAAAVEHVPVGWGNENWRVVTDQGEAAVLDFDSAEPWDPAVDLVKLRSQVFPGHQGAEKAFDRAYFGDRGCPPRWSERLRLVDLLELVNAVANAGATADPAYERRARARLDAVLGQ